MSSPFGAILREVERRILEDGDEVGEPLDLLLAIAELHGIVEVGEVGLGKLLVGIGQRANDPLIDVAAAVWLALERDAYP